MSLMTPLTPCLTLLFSKLYDAHLQHARSAGPELASKVRPEHQAVLLLADNPLVCDCDALHMARAIIGGGGGGGGEAEGDGSAARFRVKLAANQRCAGPGDLEGRRFRSLALEELKCQFPAKDFHKDKECPEHCSCR